MQQRSSLYRNLLWFLASLALAFVVWLFATIENDPVRQTVYTAIPINFQVDEGAIIANFASLRKTATVTLRARQSVLDVLTRDDIFVVADLTGLPPDTHNIRLETTISRPAFADTSPVQLVVDLVARVSRQKSVQTNITSDPPTGFEVGEITLGQTQILVSGTEEQVEEVAALEARLDLSNRRESFDDQIELIPVNANGAEISGVTVAQTVLVSVEINEREDQIEISVRPDIDFDSLSDAYVPQLQDYTPQTIIVEGPPELLDLLPDVLTTETIDLTDKTASFTVSVPVVLPLEGVTISSSSTVSVDIGIEPRIGQRTFEELPVRFTGLNPTYTARAIPSQVTVLVNGPQPILDTLTKENISVTIDLQGLAPGYSDQALTATINIGNIPPENIRVIPSTIGLIISDTTQTPNGTLAPTPTNEPTSTP